MRLGLRMGLNSRQGGGGDLPSLDLAFALDKTLTARKGPTPGFTRSSTATFIGSNGLIQSAIIDAPRFDHDPATGASKGLLIEESRTNLIATSVPGTNWISGTGAHTVTQNSTDVGVAPDGSLPTKVVCTISGVYQISFAAVVGTQYTASIYARVLSGTGPIRVGGIVLNAFTNSTATDEWARYSHTNTSATTGTRFIQMNMLAGETLYLWGAQLEAGAFPLSYIPTTSGTAARSADVCSIIGDAFSSFYNQTEGTLFASASTVASSASLFSPSSLRRIVSATDGSAANRAGLFFNTSNPSPTLVVSSGGNLSTLSAAIGSSSVASLVKIAGVYKLNDFAISANGSVVSADDLGLVGVGINRMGIGNQNEIEHLNGHIARITYFRKRLSNAKLQTLTAP